ncbi:Uncharacterised protein r2_g164 [Pycnogonum litorale]
MKDLGKLSWFLGIEFNRENDYIEMHQRVYVEKILSRFQMNDCKPKATPCEIGINKIKVDESEELETPNAYRAIVGSLIYVMTGTRPDLCYIVTKLSQYMANPKQVHLNIAKRVLRYLKCALDHGLKFQRSDTPLKLIGFCDSDWGSSDDRCSISGYCFRLCPDGSLISWKSKKQQTVALSTCEAEYIALATATQEAKFLKQLFTDMQGCEQRNILLHVDNQGAIALAKNPVYHQRSKHIDIKYHFVRSEILKGNINLQYIQTEYNIADVFTKPVTKVRLNKLLGYR